MVRLVMIGASVDISGNGSRTVIGPHYLNSDGGCRSEHARSFQFVCGYRDSWVSIQVMNNSLCCTLYRSDEITKYLYTRHD